MLCYGDKKNIGDLDEVLAKDPIISRDVRNAKKRILSSYKFSTKKGLEEELEELELDEELDDEELEDPDCPPHAVNRPATITHASQVTFVSQNIYPLPLDRYLIKLTAVQKSNVTGYIAQSKKLLHQEAVAPVYRLQKNSSCCASHI